MITSASRQPIPDAGSFYFAGGTLRPDAPSYVERQADRAPNDWQAKLVFHLLRREAEALIGPMPVKVVRFGSGSHPNSGFRPARRKPCV
jgi:hypothetical protein